MNISVTEWPNDIKLGGPDRRVYVFEFAQPKGDTVLTVSWWKARRELVEERRRLVARKS